MKDKAKIARYGNKPLAAYIKAAKRNNWFLADYPEGSNRLDRGVAVDLSNLDKSERMLIFAKTLNDYLRKLHIRCERRRAREHCEFLISHEKNNSASEKFKRIKKSVSENTNYSKILIKGKTHYYLASSVYLHQDYNKSIFGKIGNKGDDFLYEVCRKKFAGLYEIDDFLRSGGNLHDYKCGGENARR